MVHRHCLRFSNIFCNASLIWIVEKSLILHCTSRIANKLKYHSFFSPSYFVFSSFISFSSFHILFKSFIFFLKISKHCPNKSGSLYSLPVVQSLSVIFSPLVLVRHSRSLLGLGSRWTLCCRICDTIVRFGIVRLGVRSFCS